ncbi:DNA adenine modification methylase [Shewanella algicola]|uniref:DNA adenine modification methylase n=1 Tax=Shewanella algicola TaxID=640633 RepID=UPI00249449BE|nr:DNA adenine modification methylase [Shewanella algicola]
MFTNSIVSYPDRGPYGNRQYRGNCTGYLVADLIDNFLPAGGLFVDPAIGGGTSYDVAVAKGVRFFGTDLHSGFNLLVDDLETYIGEKADLCFFHPPYGNMISYSGNMWGTQSGTHKYDMSCFTDSEFKQALKLSLINISDATKANGYYGILMGNQKRKGEYINWSSIAEDLAPDPLVSEIIKVQHNCVSDTRTYTSKAPIIRIQHEKLLIFKKLQEVNAVSSFECFVRDIESNISNELLITLKRLMQCNSWTEAEILDLLSNVYAETGLNIDWKGLVAQLLKSHHFTHYAGRYSLA